jgi:hypothetical protein
MFIIILLILFVSDAISFGAWCTIFLCHLLLNK